MWTFAAPVFFMGFLSVLVPLAIHLWNRREGKRIKVGSVQWLVEAENPRFSHIQLHAWPLLLLRMAILVLLVLWMAEPYLEKLSGSNDKPDFGVLVAPELLRIAAVQQRVDSLLESGVPVRLWSFGFQPYQREQDYTELDTVPVNTFELLRALHAHTGYIPDSLEILARIPLVHLEGEQSLNSKSINWVNVPYENAEEMPLSAVLEGEEIQLQVITSSEEATNVNELTGLTSSASLGAYQIQRTEEGWALARFGAIDTAFIHATPPKTLKVGIAFSDAFVVDAKYLEAALQAVASFSPVLELQIETFDLSPGKRLDLDWLFWLTDKQDTFSFVDSIKVVRFSPEVGSDYIVEKNGSWFLTKRLDPEINASALGGSLPEDLLLTLGNSPEIKETYKAHDLRQAPNQLVMTRIGTIDTEKRYPSEKTQAPLDLYFWLGLVALVLTERLLAGYWKG